MAGGRVRESWEKYGRRGREVEVFVGLMDSMSHDQWVVVGEVEKNNDLAMAVMKRNRIFRGFPVLFRT